jgi:hypothetical protein
MNLLIVVVITLILLISIEGSTLRRLESAEERDKKWCFEARMNYDIIPGKSFGKLPFSEHNRYLRARCYRFFCKPHPMAGKGVFDCEPLETTESTTKPTESST